MSRKATRRRYLTRRKAVSKGSGRKDPTRADPYQRAARAEGYRARSAYKLMQINQRFKILRPGMMVLDLGAAPGGWSQVAARLVRAVDDPVPGAGTEGNISITSHPSEIPSKVTSNSSANPSSNSASASVSPSDVSSDDDNINNEETGKIDKAPVTRERGRVIGIDLVPIRPVAGCAFLAGDLTLQATLDLVAKLCPRGHADAVISDMSPKLSGNYDMDQARSVHLSRAALNIARMWLARRGSFVVKVFEGADFVDFRQEVKEAFGQVRSFSPSASRKASSEIYLVARGFKG